MFLDPLKQLPLPGNLANLSQFRITIRARGQDVTTVTVDPANPGAQTTEQQSSGLVPWLLRWLQLEIVVGTPLGPLPTIAPWGSSSTP